MLARCKPPKVSKTAQATRKRRPPALPPWLTCKRSFLTPPAILERPCHQSDTGDCCEPRVQGYPAMQRPGPPPQRPSAMNPLSFNRSSSGTAPSTAYSNYVPRPSPSATAGGSNPFSRGFAFGNSSLPPHLAAFAGSGGASSVGLGAGQQQPGGQSSLNINDFPALGGNGNASSSGNGSLNYANSTTGLSRPGEGLTTDDFPSLNEGFTPNGTTMSNIHEQASAAATLQHQRIAREQNQTQTLNAARGGFGEPERNYATKVGMQQPPSMSIAQTWSSAGPSGLGGFEGGISSGLDANGAGGQRDGGANNEGSNGGMEAQMLHDAASNQVKTPAHQVLTSPADRFGLLGLLQIIKMQDPDLSMLAMGSDLQTLGMSLEASDNALSASFVTPWSDNSAAASLQIEPDFHLPSCYNVQPPPPPQSKVATFSDETLFFIFYSTPRDALQEVAAQELYNRNWRFYRGGLNLWLTKEENVQPTHKDLRAEKGVYIFWDPASWSKVSREFVLAYDALEERTVGVSQAALAGTQQQQSQGGQQAPQQTAQVGA